MRVWAEIYDEDGVKLGNLTAIKSCSVTAQFDGAGSYSLDVAIDERTIAALVNDLEVRIWVQTSDDIEATEWGRGLIRNVTISDSEGGTTVTISGPDTLDGLTDTTVGIGRSYTNQSIQTIVDSLLSLDGSWTAVIEADVASDLQTTRFDGANILRCLLRMVEEKGLHLRTGTANTLEIGAFGDAPVSPNGLLVRAIKPPSVVDYELQNNDGVILIDRITQTQKSDDVVNWCIPIGAGEGSAALTLKDTTYAIYNANGTLYRAGTASRYPIYRRVNANNVIEHYIDASSGGRQRQGVVTFKEIGAVANNTTAKQLAANALAQATMAYLDRQRVPLVSYKLSAKNVQADIRPGHLLPVRYQGRIEVAADETRSAQPRLTYLDVDESMWVMKTTRKISDGQLSYDYDVSTIDRYLMDTNKILVSMMEAVQARNVSVQTYPMVFPFMAYDTMQEGTTFLSGYNQGKKARLDLRINDYITDVTRVELRFITLPLHVTGRNLFSSPNYWTVFDVVTSSEYPSGISLFIDDVDVSASVTDIDSSAAGPWNVGSNSATDKRIDISSYIVDDPGGIYQNFKIELHCEHRSGNIAMGGPDPTQTTNASKGYAFMIVYVFGSMRGIG